MDNNELIKKADIAVSDLATNGGLLNPEQTDSFIRKMLVVPTILNQSRVVRMNGPERKINKIGFGSRILRPGVSATALAAADRSAPATEQITLTSKEVIAEVKLPYDVIEDNIENAIITARNDTTQGNDPGSIGGIKDTIISMIAEQAALDLEELLLLGDTASVDPYLAMLDGYLKLATSNVVDFAAAPVTRALFKAGIKAMPDQYLRNLAVMKHFLSVNQRVEYQDTIAERQTGQGDAAGANAVNVYGMGAPVEAASLMPEDQGLFTNPQNLIFGVQRRITIETEKVIRERAYNFVLTARVACAIEEPDAVVAYTNIG